MWVSPEQQQIVGDCLAAARKHIGLTQQELARKLGKPQSFVSAYEAGQRRIDVLELLRIAKELSADPHQILSEIISKQVSA